MTWKNTRECTAWALVLVFAAFFVWVGLRGGHFDVREFRKPRTGEILIRVLDEHGRRAENARVVVTGPVPAPLLTDSRGEVLVRLRPWQDFKVAACRGDSCVSTSSVTIPPELTSVCLVLRLRPGATLVGRVVDESGVPVPEFGVALGWQGTRAADHGPDLRWIWTDLGSWTGGEFRLGPLETPMAGDSVRYEIHVFAPGYRRYHAIMDGWVGESEHLRIQLSR